jgi:hypothetical protein
MTIDNQAVRAYFFKLGLTQEIADIYLALLTYGPQSMSGLARYSGVERTRIYRLIDELTASHLIEVEVQYKKNIFRAAPITNLQLLLTRKAEELGELQSELKVLHQTLTNNMPAAPATRIQFYKGPDGVKQMYWNQTKSTTEVVSILYENMQTRTNLAFFERWVHACNEKNLKFRGLINDNFIKTQQEWYSAHTNERLNSWQARRLSDTIFPITHSVVVYNDVTAYFNWKDGEIFGIEMYNQQIADSQRQVFEILWRQASPVDDTEGLDTAAPDPY